MMKTQALAVAVAGATGAVVAALLFASQAWSQPRSLDLAVYTPIGVVQSPTGAHSIAWVLDATNRRVVMCSQKLNDNAAKIECRSGDLPKE
jgi:hypothetical protein